MAHRQKHRDAAASRRAGVDILTVDEPYNLNDPADLAAMDEVAEAFEDAKAVTDPLDVSPYAEAILLGLQHKPVYQGPRVELVRPRTSTGPVGVAEPFDVYDTITVGRHLTEDKIARRRRRNAIAKRSRRINQARRRGDRLAVALLIFAMLIGGGAAGLSVPRANALTYGVTLTVSAQWTGGNCWARGGTQPDEHDPRTLRPFYVSGCTDTAVSRQVVMPGQYGGIDPDIGNAEAVYCIVTNTATGRVIDSDYARLNDGHDASCLGKWAL